MNGIKKLKLTPEQSSTAVAEIKGAMAAIQSERDEQDLENKWQKAQMFYDGTYDRRGGPWEGAAQFHINQLMMSVDVTTLKAKRQTLQAKPLILLEPAEDGVDHEELKDREDWLDYKLRKQVDVASFYSPLYRQAVLKGTAILKIPWLTMTEEKDETIKYTPEQIEQYQFDSRQKYNHNETTIAENMITLASGGHIEFEAVESVERYSCPKPYIVPIQNFYVRPSISDLYRQKIISEKRELTWMDIQQRLDSGYYDAEGVKIIKEKRGDKYEEAIYCHYETILYSDFMKKGKFRRYVLTLDDESDAVLRCIAFPYEHYKMFYAPYRVMPREDSFYGYGFWERGGESNEMLNRLWNSIFDMADLHSNPPKAVSGKVKVPADPGPGVVWYGDENSKISPLVLTQPNTDYFNLIQMGIRMDELISGVTSGMSGRESASDPGAPAAKTAMLMSAGNERIEDYIQELQQGNAELAEQVEKLYLQYKPEELRYYDGKWKGVERELIEKSVRYVPHGTEVALNKQYELAMIGQFMQFMAYFPDVIQDPEKRNILLGAFIDAIGGTIEKHKKDLIPNLEINPVLQALSHLPPDRLQAMGEAKLSEVMETVAEMMMGGQQPGGQQ